ncbi:SAT2 [Bugula neritina]|uniref:SAT2 n=1 Tax=Bugula neritina TaxID=10212 RepID=A0A7J7ITY0_BUGNE|nr:SAT2 [Bugula neritina]
MADEFTVRKAVRADCKDIWEMFLQLQAMSDVTPEQVKFSKEALQRDGFDCSPPLFHCFVAEFRGVAIGYALYSYQYSAYEGGLEMRVSNLFVKEVYRCKGVGKLLFEALIEKAKQQKTVGIEWMVLNWNRTAIKFYENFGAQDLTITEKVHAFRISLSE